MLKFGLSDGLSMFIILASLKARICFILFSSVKLSFKSLDEAPHVAASWAAQTSTVCHGYDSAVRNPRPRLTLATKLSCFYYISSQISRNGCPKSRKHYWLYLIITYYYLYKTVTVPFIPWARKKHDQSRNSAFRPTDIHLFKHNDPMTQ